MEETGPLDFLGGRLTSDQGPFEALILSCHGDIDREKGPDPFAGESAGRRGSDWPGRPRQGAGNRSAASGGSRRPAARQSLAGKRPRRAALADAMGRGRRTGCGTGARHAEVRSSPRRSGARLAARIANVVGWDGSVYDADATDFARDFYQELAKRSSSCVPAAGARLFAQEGTKSEPRPALASGAGLYRPRKKGGGSLCGQGRPRRRPVIDRVFLDQARDVCRLRRGRSLSGGGAPFSGAALVLGEAERHPDRRDGRARQVELGGAGRESDAAIRPVVIFERYDGLAILDQALEALDATDPGCREDQWRERSRPILRRSPFRWRAGFGPLDERPVLLIIDDLERILETPSQNDLPPGSCRPIGRRWKRR